MGINAVFEALSHPVRRKILALLRTGPLSAGELAAHFDIAKPTLSVHFAKLKDAELVSVEQHWKLALCAKRPHARPGDGAPSAR